MRHRHGIAAFVPVVLLALAAGDRLDFTDEWKNHGVSVVSHCESPRELRFANDPDDGSSVCQSRFVLTATGAGTTLRWIESYSDESPPRDLQATADKVAAQVQKSLALVKAAVEKR